MIINVIHKRKNTIAIVLLIAFNTVFASDFLCDVGIVNKSSGHDANHHEHDGDHHEKSISVHQDGHDHAINEQDQHKHDKQNKDEEDNCCEVETDQVFTSLIKKNLTKISLKEIPVLLNTPLDLPCDYNFVYYKKHNPYSLKSTLSPPLRGSQIRVLYQSFLC